MKRILIILFTLFAMFGIANAIDYDNITFTNEEFYNGAVTQTKTIELSNGKLAVSYVKSSDSNSYLKICDLDGTNCGSETQIINAMTSVGLDMFEDTTNNRIIAVTGRTSSSRFVSFNLTGGDKQTHVVFDAGNTNYVSAVQVNSTDFSIGYEDTAGKFIFCKLDGSSCGTEKSLYGGNADYIKQILKSDGDLAFAFYLGTTGGYVKTYDVATQTQQSANSFNTGATSSIDMIEGSDNKLKIVYRDDASTNDGTFRSCDLDGTNCGSEIVYHSGVATYNSLQEINDKLFVQYQKETTGEGLSLNFNLTGGDISSTSSFNVNSTSYISSVYTSNNQLVISYNDNTASKGMFAISESLPAGATITFNNPTQGQYLNSTSIPLNVTFSTITNSTYILNAGNETTLCTNCNESSNVTLTGVEGLNNLTILTNTSGQLTNSSINFTIDTITPTINNSIPTEINDYAFNGSWFSCSDTNIDSCNVSINGFNQASGTNFTLTNNGNLSYTITAIDLAGNTATANGFLFVNPRIFFSFNDSGTLIENYTFGGRSDVSGLVNYTIYNDGLGIGNHTLEFSKLGYILQNFTFEFTNTTNVNYVFNVSQAIINVNIYDRDTEALITDNVSLQLIGPIGDTASTVTGQTTLQAINGTAGDYQIIASTANYETESIYFTYSNQENISLDIYMLNSTDLNLGFVTVEVKDTLSFFIEEAIVNLLEWKPSESAYVSVAECQTVSNGKCNLNVELNDKLYKFQATKNGDTKTTASQIITTTGTLVPITLEDITLTATPNSDNIVATFTESINNVTNISTARLEWNLLDGTTGRACITVYSNPGFSQSVLGQNCTSSSSGILFLTTEINNSFNIEIVGTVADSFNTYTIDSFFHEGTGSLAAALQEYNIDIIIPLIFFFIGLGAGLFFGNIYIGLSLGVVLEWIATIIAPNVMSVSMAIVISTISGLIMWGLSRK